MKKRLLAALLCLMLLTPLMMLEALAADVQLRFIDVSPSPVRQEYFEKTFAKFKEETGISVVYESVPWDDAANS